MSEAWWGPDHEQPYKSCQKFCVYSEIKFTGVCSLKSCDLTCLCSDFRGYIKNIQGRSTSENNRNFETIIVIKKWYNKSFGQMQKVWS